MSSRPNVVVCLCDQLRPFEVGCYGSEFVQTPYLDRMAENGVRFEIACTNNPVCTAARSALLTGQYSRTCVGTSGNAREPVPERDRMLDSTLAEVFQAAGYRIGLIGKWHIDPRPELLGFQTVLYPNHQHRYTGQTYYGNDRRETLVEGFSVDYELDELGRWISERRNEPFFLFHNISQPHMPVWDAPERFRDMYKPEEVPLRENVWLDGQMAYDERWFTIYMYTMLYYQNRLDSHPERLPDGFDLRRLAALYCGMVTWTDYQVGRLMAILEEDGLADNTVVVFTSDHGDHLGSHHLFNKDSLYEEALRIPMLYHWPVELKPRAVDSQVTSLVDVMPTILSLAGLSAPPNVQGADLSAVLRGEAQTVGENVAFCESAQSQVGVRTLTHLYGFKKRPGRGPDPDVSFFDLTDDPMEMRNLAASGRQSDLEANLRERARRWDLHTPWLAATKPPWAHEQPAL